MSLSMLEQAKGKVSGKLIGEIARRIEEGREKDLAVLFRLISAIAPAKYHRAGFEAMSRMAEENHPFVGTFKRAFRDLNPYAKKKLISNLLVNFVVLGRGIRDHQEKALGLHLPNFLVISPTMRCNLHCKGCYAGEYGKGEELPFDELDRILTEAKALGMYFFTFTGGSASSGKTCSTSGKSMRTASSRSTRTARCWTTAW